MSPCETTLYRWEIESSEEQNLLFVFFSIAIADRVHVIAIVSADSFSRSYEASKHPEEHYQDEVAKARADAHARLTSYEKFMAFGKENRYSIVGGSWIASMALALTLVGRNPYLSTQQKLVQARVYAQALTVGVLLATAAFEIGDRNNEEGRWETVKIIDPNDPEHKHLVEKKIHHERYAGEDQWRGEHHQLPIAIWRTIS